MNAETRKAIDEWNAMCDRAHKKWGSLALSEPEVVVLLTNLAAMNATTRGTLDADPIVEAVEDYVWWDICNALSRESRVIMQKGMKETGIPLPPHPGDIIERR